MTSLDDGANPPEGAFLARLPPEDVALLRERSRTSTLPERHILFREGDPAFETFIIERGMLKVSMVSPDGREIVLDVRSDGELLGELAAIAESTRSATATTLVETKLLILGLPEFRALLDTRPAIARGVLHVVAERLKATSDRVLEFGASDSLARVCRRLVELGRASPTFELPVSQQELADWAGLSREAVVKALRALRSLNWIETDGRTVKIRDLGALRDRAGYFDEQA